MNTTLYINKLLAHKHGTLAVFGQQKCLLYYMIHHLGDIMNMREIIRTVAQDQALRGIYIRYDVADKHIPRLLGNAADALAINRYVSIFALTTAITHDGYIHWYNTLVRLMEP